MEINVLSSVIIEESIAIHRDLGSGMLESVYVQVLAHRLRRRGLKVELEVPIPVEYDGIRLEVGFRADMIVQDLIIVEAKSIERLTPTHKKVLLTYLRLANKPLGLLINYGQELLKDGICRLVNGSLENT
jgi:GxxExxY protein